MAEIRRAEIMGKPWGQGTLTEAVEAYLPRGYHVVAGSEHKFAGAWRVIIEGEDYAGWTLEGYVLPRLASGLYFGKEII